MDLTRFEHTIKCIDHNYQNITKKINLTVFRDFNGVVKDEIDKQFNEYAIREHDILSKLSDNYEIFWLVNATHDLWFNESYKQQIINQIYKIINCDKNNKQNGGTNNHYKYMEYKSKYLKMKILNQMTLENEGNDPNFN